jgi:peptide/nickel transport system permease protein
MFGYFVRRLVAAALVMVATSMVVFALFFYGPADPAAAMCPDTRCTQERLDNITESLGLDRPVTEQYGEYMKGIFVGRQVTSGSLSIDCEAPCLGVSFKQRLDVADLLFSRFPATLSLAVGAAVIFLVVGVSIGIFAARRRGTAADRLVVGASLVLSAIPYYLVVLLSYLYLVSKWGIFGETRYEGLTEVGFFAWANALLLPWLVLGLVYSTQYARFSRGSMVEALNEDFVRTARAKGLSSGTVVRRHALRAAIVPIVTIFGLDFAGLLAGTIFAEKIFGIRGIGLTALDAIQNSDLPIIMATVLLASFFVVCANIIVDLLYSIIDPRVRLS